MPSIPSPYKGFVCPWTRRDGCSSVATLQPRAAAGSQHSYSHGSCSHGLSGCHVAARSPLHSSFVPKKEKETKGTLSVARCRRSQPPQLHVSSGRDRKLRKSRLLRSSTKPAPLASATPQRGERICQAWVLLTGWERREGDLHSQPWICRGEPELGTAGALLLCLFSPVFPLKIIM